MSQLIYKKLLHMVDILQQRRVYGAHQPTNSIMKIFISPQNYKRSHQKHIQNFPFYRLFLLCLPRLTTFPLFNHQFSYSTIQKTVKVAGLNRRKNYWAASNCPQGKHQPRPRYKVHSFTTDYPDIAVIRQHGMKNSNKIRIIYFFLVALCAMDI